MVALCCAVTTPVHAAQGPVGAPANTSEAAEARGQALAKEGKYLAAAGALVEALRGVPNNAESRNRRSQLVIEAVNAYKLAFQGAPSECAPLVAGLTLADDYLSDLRVTYGAGAMAEEDYGAVSSQRNKLDDLRTKHSCPEPEKQETPQVTPGPPPEAPKGTPTPEGPASAGGTSTPGTSVDQPGPGSRSRAFGVGLGISAGLTIGMAIGGGVLYSQLRKQGGWRYDAIRAAAEDNMVPTDEQTDMCKAGADVQAVSEACGAWNSGYRGFLGMTVLAGVFAVSTAVFTGLLIRERRAQRSLAQAWQRHQVQLGAAPRFGGATLTAGFRF